VDFIVAQMPFMSGLQGHVMLGVSDWSPFIVNIYQLSQAKAAGRKADEKVLAAAYSSPHCSLDLHPHPEPPREKRSPP
jgi:hypothetical protein